MYIGIGYDIHRFGADRPLILGGVRFPGESGLVGHSDADPVMHAIADAVLGAAALGDLGQHFPDTEARWENADSADILGQVLRMVREKRSLVPGNVDVNVVAERPRLAERTAEMRRRLAEVLHLSVERVSVKGRSAEGLGPVGRGKAVEVHAAVLLVSADP
ncbi:MAG: 2-C-methyl-D-erythritol 2,4-cyclodiphosphate synthase [Candidatus Brocadiaceae bacterium]|jgi:2-C-methyl-D-erythritol 2,4-cyclodiphosphate synthase